MSIEGHPETISPKNGDPKGQIFLGKPRDAKRWSSRQIFLSYPHTHDRFLYSQLAKFLKSPLKPKIILMKPSDQDQDQYSLTL